MASSRVCLVAGIEGGIEKKRESKTNNDMKCTVKRWSPTCLPGCCYMAADNKSKRGEKEMI
jgi:hypothetical protein